MTNRQIVELKHYGAHYGALSFITRYTLRARENVLRFIFSVSHEEKKMKTWNSFDVKCFSHLSFEVVSAHQS